MVKNVTLSCGNQAVFYFYKLEIIYPLFVWLAARGQLGGFGFTP
jgi:hypothetical protein